MRFAYLILSHTGGNPNGEEEKKNHLNGLLEKKRRSEYLANKYNLHSRLHSKTDDCL